MVTIIDEINLPNFQFWSGAKDRVKELTYEQMEELDGIISDTYPDGIGATELNDWFWSDEDSIAELLGFKDFETLVRYNNGEEIDEYEEE